LVGGPGNDVLHGGAGNDNLSGDAGDDLIFGDDGDDRLTGGDGADRLDGGRGKDALSGGTGNDNLYGGDGPDALEGGQGNDRLSGGAGPDALAGGPGSDIVDGGSGPDRIDAGGVSGSTDRVTPDAADTVVNLPPAAPAPLPTPAPPAPTATAAPPIVVDAPPAAPTSLSALRTRSGVMVVWAASDGATSYLVERVWGNASAVLATPTGTSFFDAAPPVGGIVSYVITARNAAGDSLPSGVEVLVAPVLEGHAAGASAIRLSFLPFEDSDAGFDVYRASGRTLATMVLIATVPVSTSYLDQNLQPNAGYRYSVVRHGDGASSEPAVTAMTAPLPAEDVQFVAQAHRIDVTFRLPLGGAYEYQLLCGGGADAGYDFGYVSQYDGSYDGGYDGSYDGSYDGGYESDDPGLRHLGVVALRGRTSYRCHLVLAGFTGETSTPVEANVRTLYDGIG
jgi:hypothetical protein